MNKNDNKKTRKITIEIEYHDPDRKRYRYYWYLKDYEDKPVAGFAPSLWRAKSRARKAANRWLKSRQVVFTEEVTL